jgi:PKD repeat protein
MRIKHYKMKRFIPFLILLFTTCTLLNAQIEKTNKLPVVKLEIASVSGDSLIAPVWLKFYPAGTYDPDGKIIKFEMDFNGDGIYDIQDSVMQAGTFEFTEPGEYTASLRVTDDAGGVTIETQRFLIAKRETVVEEVHREAMTNEEDMDKEESTTPIDPKPQEVPTVDTAIISIESEPLTTKRMYEPDSIIKSGRWGTAKNIRADAYFDKFETAYMEPGVKWKNGMYTAPDYQPTEMIYYHDQSDLQLQGYVAILDCIDYCGSIGDCGFIIKGDGKEIWNSGIVRHKDQAVAFDVSLEGVRELRLIVNYGGDDLNEDWGAWLDLKVVDIPEARPFKEEAIKEEEETPFFGFNFGILGGASYYLVNDDDISRLTNFNPSLYNLTVDESVFGYHLGFLTQMRFWRILIRPEFIVNYSTINYQVEDVVNASNNTTATEGLIYLDIPVLLGYKYQNYRIMGGLVGHLFVSNHSELEDIGNFKKDFESFSFGYQTGVGFDKSRFGIDLRFEGNFRQFGDGVINGGNRIYFGETPHRVMLSLVYNMN